MKRVLILMLISLIAAILLNRTYNTVGWHYFEMPYPDLIARIFRLGGEAHYNAVEFEVFLECFVGALFLVFGADWIRRRKSY